MPQSTLILRNLGVFFFLCSLPTLLFGAPATNDFFIDQTSIDTYRQYVVPETLPLVQSGQWVLEVRASSVSSFEDKEFLGKKFTSDDVVQILKSRNSAVRVSSNFDAKTYDGYAASYSLYGQFARVFPGQLENKKFQQQAFRERVGISYSSEIPPSLWLTYRFEGTEDDIVFYLSPVLQKVRRSTSSSRTDTIFGTEMNLNDLLGSAEKIGNANFASMKPEILVVPVVLHDRPEQIQSNCSPLSSAQGVSASPSGAGVPSSQEGSSYLLGAGWLPTGVTYQPARLLRVEVTLQDPYAMFHQLLLYVNVDNGTVPYKISLNRKGEPQKFTLATYEEIDGVPYLKSVAVKNLQSDRATLINFKGYSICEDATADTLLDDFTPAALESSVK